MGIIVNLDVMMAKRKMSLNELSEKVGLTLANLSILKQARQKQSVSAGSMQYVKCWITPAIIMLSAETSLNLFSD